MKKITFLLSGIVLLLTLVVYAFYGFGKIINTNCDCERFNIDNIELRTGINIPSIKNVECTYDKRTKTKKISFIIETEKVTIEDYILENKFVLSDSEKLYIKSNDTKNYSYKITLNKVTGKLDIEIIYKDK
jgi:hypothetical protein